MGNTDEEAADAAAAASSSTATEKQQKKWHQRTEIRLLLLLLLVGGIAGLAVGLTVGNNNDADGGASSSSSTSSEVETTTVDGAGDISPMPPPDAETGTEPEAAAEVATTAEDRTAVTDSPTPNPSPSRNNVAVDSTTNPTPAGSGFYVAVESSIYPTPAGSIFSYNTGPAGPPSLATKSLPPTMIMTPLIVDRTCDFELSQTVLVSAPSYSLGINGGNVTEATKKVSGGTSAFDGNTAVIVSYNSNGTEGGLFTLAKTDDDGWEQSDTIQTTESDQLGWDLGVKGNSGGGANDNFVIGAPGHLGDDRWIGMDGWYWAGRGRAYVMGRSDGSGGDEGDWYRQGILEPGVGDDHGDFGSSVDIAECGCLIAVGAWHDRDSRGSVYIYSKSDDTNEWTEIQKLAPVDSRRSQTGHMHGNYGYTVAINDDYLAVKAPYDSFEGSYDQYDPNRGMVYVYKKQSDGTFEEVSRLYTAEGKQVSAHLTDITFLDDFLLVGAPGNNKVYVFKQTTDGSYQKTAELVPSDEIDPVKNNFGISLDSGGGSNNNRVMVGDYGGDASYLFSYEDGAWKEKAKFDGFNTAMSGDSLVEHTPKSFGMSVNGLRYEGEVNFYDLVCE